jgi:septal ring factor EnvC (AmiA/AmiB activator)
MMSDLIERLRRYCCCDQQGQLIAELVGDMHEAADEIERLEKDIDESNDENAGYIDRLFEQKAEIERLREALERIASGCDLSNEAQAIAHNALSQSADSP